MPNAFSRLVVPDTPVSPLTKSTYLRLGSYSSEEDNIVTGLTTTLTECLTETSKHKSNNAGILAFTNQDLQANVEGAALMKIGRGLTTEVTSGNSQHMVSNGTYEISAENGVSITAGANGTSADITLTASNHVNVINKGHKCELNDGNYEKRTMGNTNELFKGTKFTCMKGAAITMFLGGAFTCKVSREHSVNLSNMSSVTIGNKIDIVKGENIAQVIGNSAKTVFGPDYKSADSDTKILKTSDFKLVPVEDFKKVGRDCKVCKSSVSATEKEITRGELSVAQHKLVNRKAEIMSSIGNQEVVQKQLIIFI